MPKDASGHAPGTKNAYDSVEKWLQAALRALGKTSDDLVLPTYDPNCHLASEIHSKLTEWHTNRTTALNAGVIARPALLDRPPPNEVLVKARGWMLREINQIRYDKKRLPELASDWGRTLAGRKADARAVNTANREHKAETGTLYHHKHDIQPSFEQITEMTYLGFSADQCIDAGRLEAVEAGMALGLYMPTGARGSELKRMHLQSLKHLGPIQIEKHGVSFEGLRLIAFDTKNGKDHPCELLPHSNPHRCGVGLLGLSLLMRVKLYGPPPFSMQTDANSWKLYGTSVGASMDRRLRDLFEAVGVKRQSGDQLTGLGRHYGTQLLQHAGGSAEGGERRTNHESGGAHHKYTSVPLPDLLRMAGNDADQPFVPAHLHADLSTPADAVLAILFPQLQAEENELHTRDQELVGMRGNIVQIRTKEQLEDKKMLIRAIRLACRTALCCLAGRPRRWEKWAIIEDAPTLWEAAGKEVEAAKAAGTTPSKHRAVLTLFAGNRDALEAMNQLALAVLRCEEAEIAGRQASPEGAVENALVSAVKDAEERARVREEQMMRQNQAMFAQLAAMVNPNGPVPALMPPPPPPSLPPPPPPPETASAAPVTTTVRRLKHKRETQEDVVYFSTWGDMGQALEYAKTELAPREKEDGAKWRRIIRADGREDKARDFQWRSYRAVAIAVGVLQKGGATYPEAVAAVQARFDAFGVKAHTPLKKALDEEQKSMRDAERIAKEVLGY